MTSSNSYQLQNIPSLQMNTAQLTLWLSSIYGGYANNSVSSTNLKTMSFYQNSCKW